MVYEISDLCVKQQGLDVLTTLPRDIGLELFMNKNMPLGWEDALSRVLEDRDSFSVHAYPSIMNPALDIEMRNELMTHSLDTAARYGAKYVVLHPTCDVYEMDGSLRKQITEQLGIYCREAREKGVVLALENLFPNKDGIIAFDEEQFIALIHSFPQMRCLIDVGHLIISGWDMEKTITALKDRIVAYHVHDNDGASDSHCRVCSGIFDVERFMDICCAETPDSVLVMEYEKHVTLREAMEDIDYLKRYARKE